MTPQSLAGVRIEPDAPVALATATIPAATAAAEPPLEPPGEREVSKGLRVGPQAAGFVEAPNPSSSRFVLPIRTNPGSRIRWTKNEVVVGAISGRLHSRQCSGIELAGPAGRGVSGGCR
jgi:hypothetical protein